MKGFRLCRKMISCVLVALMTFSACATVFAASPETPLAELKYVSLGDSMSNGYGLDGYDGNTGVEDYGEDSYANQFANWLAGDGGYASAVDHTQLAMSAMRAEDLHWLLELDYNDAEQVAASDMPSWDETVWNENFTTGDYWTWREISHDYRAAVAVNYILAKQGDADAAAALLANPNARKSMHGEAGFLAEYYQTAVRDADIVSLGMGNGNFGVFAFGRIMEAIGFGVADEDKDAEAMKAMVYKVENAIRECDPAMQTKILALKDTLYEKVTPLRAQFSAFSDAQWNALLNTIVYTGVSYVLNYAGSLEAILQLNPDADIILVALMNTFAEPGTEVDYSNIDTIGGLMGAIFKPLNMFIAGLPTYMQAVNNGVYKDATFYYAEAPEVQCLVNTWTGFEGASLSRDRFVQSVVGTAGDPGMVWGLLAPMVGGMIPGATLSYIDIDDVVAYEAKSDTEKAVYAAGNMNDAISCALYLAFEDAIVAAAGGAPVDLDSVMGLGNMNASIFGGVFGRFNENIGTNGAQYAGTATDFVAPQVEAGIDSALGNATIVDLNMVKNMMAGNLAVGNVVAGIMSADPSIAPLLGVHGDFAGVLGCDGTYTPYCSNCLGVQATYNGYVSNLSGAIELGNSNVSQLCMLLALPTTLSAALQQTPEISGLLGLFARCIIGNGLGAHPSEGGHVSLFETVKSVYEEGYTAKDETIKNVTAIINKYYDEAYAYAYAKADEKGYVDKAADVIDQAIKTIYALDISDVQMTDEFRVKLEAELAAVVVTLNEVKTILKEDVASDINGLNQSVNALWGDLNAHLTNAGALLDQAELDIKTLVVPVVDAYVRAQIESLKETFKTEAAKAGHKPFKADADSYYVAIGGDTVKGVGIGRDENGYYDLVGAHYNISKKTVSQSKLLPSGVLGLITANQAEIAKADLITLQLDASSILYATLSDTPDWNKYLDAEEKAFIEEIFTQIEEILTTNWTEYANAKLEEIIPKIKAAVLAKLPEDVPFASDIFDAVAEIAVSYLKNVIAEVEAKADGYVSDIASRVESLDEMVKDYAEKLAYAVVSYAAESEVAVKAIQAINPDATLVVAGMYNPVKGLVIKTENGEFDAGAMFASAVDAANLYYTANAVKNGNVAFVDISDADTNGFNAPIDATALEIDQIATMILGVADSMHANAAGHVYISEQIIKALTCVPGKYEAIDEETHAIKCVLCEEILATEEHKFTDNKCDDCGYTKVVVPDEGEGEEDNDKPSYGGSGGGGAVSDQFVIKFVTNGGNTVKNVAVKKGALLTAPTAPAKTGYVFDGWYTDKALTAKYDFATPVTKAFTLYAKWVKADAKFGDIDLNAWYFEYVKAAMEAGLMNGISDTEFAPNATLTRGMFVTVLHRIEKEAKAENGTEFTDVPKDAYYANAVKWAAESGIVLGVSDTEFAPNAEVTREQMAAIIARYAEYKNLKAVEKEDATYADEDQIAEYAKEAVQVANKLGILIGNEDGSFAPKKNATRAEAATLFVRLLDLLNK